MSAVEHRRGENPYDHISDRGGPAPVMQSSYDWPAGLDNPRSKRRGRSIG